MSGITSSIRAVVVDPAAPDRLVLRDVPPPTPRPDEAVVRVSAVSLNLGEVRGALTTAAAGARPGWDLAGVVEQAAADGSGPAAGSRVVGLVRAGSWSQLVAVPTGALAPLPPGVSFTQAATLPVAGLTALHAVERGTRLLARPALITGASGGVGLFACQIAGLVGARPFGLIRRPAYAEMVRAAGAEPVVGEDATPARPFGPFRLVVESVGGRTLATALDMLAPDGVCVSFGASAGSQVTFDLWSLPRVGRASLYGLTLFNEFGRESAALGLERLAGLVAAGRLRPHVAVEEPWTELPRLARGLYERRVPGKAVLRVA